jgi:hypothetical protein
MELAADHGGAPLKPFKRSKINDNQLLPAGRTFNALQSLIALVAVFRTSGIKETCYGSDG